MKKKIYLIPVLIVVMGLIGFLVRSFVYWNLFLPITNVVHFLAQIISSIDQKIIWSFLIVAITLIFLVVFLRQKTEPAKTAYTFSSHTEDRLAYWERLIRNAERNPSNRVILQQKLLTISLEDELQDERNVLPDVKNKRFANCQQTIQLLKNLAQPKKAKLVDRELENALEQILEVHESRLED